MPLVLRCPPREYGWTMVAATTNTNEPSVNIKRGNTIGCKMCRCVCVCEEKFIRAQYTRVFTVIRGKKGCRRAKSASASICTLIRGDDKGFWYFLKSQGLLSARSIFRMIIRSFARIIAAATTHPATGGKAFRRILRYLYYRHVGMHIIRVENFHIIQSREKIARKNERVCVCAFLI